MGPDYGRIAYEAYCQAEAKMSGAKQSNLPSWDELFEEGRQRWIAIGEAVARAALTTN